MLTPQLLPYKVKGFPCYRLELDWDSFVHVLQHEKKDPLNKYKDTSQRQELHYPFWSGTSSYEEAIDFLLKGWKEGRENIDKVIASLPSSLFDNILPAQSFAKTEHNVVAGGSIDMGLASQDIGPTQFIEETQDENKITTGNKLQTIYVNCSNNSDIDPEMFYIRGSLMYSLANHLETCGYNTEVYAFNSTQALREDMVQITYIKIKHFNEVFDQHKMLIAMCSAFMLRRFYFFLRERYSLDIVNAFEAFQDGGYGKSIGHFQPEEIKLQEKENHLILDVCNENDKDAIIEEFKKMLGGLKIVSHDGQFGPDSFSM